MGVFGAVVSAHVALSLAMVRPEAAGRSVVGCELIGRDGLRVDFLVFQNPSKQLGRYGVIARFLNLEVEHLSFIIDGAQEAHRPPAYPNDRLTEPPKPLGWTATPAQQRCQPVCCK